MVMFAPGPRPDLKKLADEHLQHDLRQEDRDALQQASKAVGLHLIVGQAIGVSLGVFLAYRIRANRTAIFNAFKAQEQPVAVKFYGGREELIPDITPMMRPSGLGTFATYTFLGAGGYLIGSQFGFLSGAYSGQRSIRGNKDSEERIQRAFKSFQADVLRKQADELEKKESVLPFPGQ